MTIPTVPMRQKVSRKELNDNGYIVNTILGTLWAYCQNCGEYGYHYWMQKDYIELVVCKECDHGYMPYGMKLNS